MNWLGTLFVPIITTNSNRGFGGNQYNSNRSASFKHGSIQRRYLMQWASTETERGFGPVYFCRKKVSHADLPIPIYSSQRRRKMKRLRVGREHRRTHFLIQSSSTWKTLPRKKTNLQKLIHARNKTTKKAHPTAS